jgi:phage nucleotide-binding protein
MSLKDKIKTPDKMVDQQGAKLLVYGQAGAGKTFSTQTMPGRVLVISAEAGLLSIKDAPNVSAIEVKTYDDLREVYAALKSGELDYDSVCLDSVSEISEILLVYEKGRNKDGRMAYQNVSEAVTSLMRSFRDLDMHVLFLCKEGKENNDGVFLFGPKMASKPLGDAITYFFDEVLALRIVDDQDVAARWLQTRIGQGYTAKDRSGKLEAFEEPNLTALIEKLGFNINLEEKKESA